MIKSVKTILGTLGLKSKPRLLFTDVERLYADTLFFSGAVRPWAVKDGKYVALDLRRAFVADYLSNKADFHYKKNRYYAFIENYTKEGFSKVYDGNQSYAIVNADEICKRYMVLIDSIVNNIAVYNNLSKHNLIESMRSIYDEIIDFETVNKREVFYIKEKRRARQRENKRYEADRELLKSRMCDKLVGHLIPSAIMYNDKIILKNGSHRLALFKVLKEKGLFTNEFAIYIVERIRNGLHTENIGPKNTR